MLLFNLLKLFKKKKGPYLLADTNTKSIKEEKDILMKIIKMDRLINPNKSDETCKWQENFSEKDQRKIRKQAIKYLKRKLDEIEENKDSHPEKLKENLEELKYIINEIIKELKHTMIKIHGKKTQVHDSHVSHVNIGRDLAVIMLGSKIAGKDTLSAECVPECKIIQSDQPYIPQEPPPVSDPVTENVPSEKFDPDPDSDLESEKPVETLVRAVPQVLVPLEQWKKTLKKIDDSDPELPQESEESEETVEQENNPDETTDSDPEPPQESEESEETVEQENNPDETTNTDTLTEPEPVTELLPEQGDKYIAELKSSRRNRDSYTRFRPKPRSRHSIVKPQEPANPELNPQEQTHQSDELEKLKGRLIALLNRIRENYVKIFGSDRTINYNKNHREIIEKAENALQSNIKERIETAIKYMESFIAEQEKQIKYNAERKKILIKEYRDYFNLLQQHGYTTSWTPEYLIETYKGETKKDLNGIEKAINKLVNFINDTINRQNQIARMQDRRNIENGGTRVTGPVEPR